MRRQRTPALGATLFCAALVLAACQSSASATRSATQSRAASLSAAPSIKFLACVVTDSAGVDDNGFHQRAVQGTTRAQSRLGAPTTVLASSADTASPPTH